MRDAQEGVRIALVASDIRAGALDELEETQRRLLAELDAGMQQRLDTVVVAAVAAGLDGGKR